MFPFVRLFANLAAARKMPRLESMTDVHVSHHRCLPWDLDMFMELNNGRALTLFDLGRLAMAQRIGLIDVLKANRWGLTMAGSSVRYRQRIRMWEKFEVRSRAVCWDDKFTYLEQSMWKMDGTCANHVLYRAAVTDKNGLVRPPRLAEAMGTSPESPPIPAWIANWIAAEDTRPWPPMQDEDAPLRAVA
ncbi:MAG: acyl-CoA thioesterase [Rhodobacteraceae bacterium]|nr:acyl-CoA thioesterase [Paracoccaceae bacterium]